MSQPIYNPNSTSADANQSTSLPPEQTQTLVPAKAATTTMYVEATSLNIRETPSAQAPSVGKLVRGDKIEVAEILKSGWARLAPKAGDKPGVAKYVLARAGVGKLTKNYLTAKPPAPLKPNVPPPPAPTPAMPDQPPPPPQDTQEGMPVGMMVGIALLGIAVVYFLTKKD